MMQQRELAISFFAPLAMSSPPSESIALSSMPEAEPVAQADANEHAVMTKSKSRKLRRQRLTQARQTSKQCVSDNVSVTLAATHTPHELSMKKQTASREFLRSSAEVCVAGTISGAADRRWRLMRRFQGHVVELALRAEGCRALQAAVEELPRRCQAELFAELRGHVTKLAKHKLGNFVLQRCLEQMHPEDLSFVAEEINGSTLDLAKDEFGCRVLQRLLEFWGPCRLLKVLDELMICMPQLVGHKFGCFVVLHLLEYGRIFDRLSVIAEVMKHLESYAAQRYSRGIVAKCAELARLAGDEALRREEPALAQALRSCSNRHNALPNLPEPLPFDAEKAIPRFVDRYGSPTAPNLSHLPMRHGG